MQRELAVQWCFAGAAALLVGPLAAGGNLLHVDDDAALGGDGLSWGTALRYLQDALATAAGDATINEIRVARGSYVPDQDEAGGVTPGDRQATFQLLNGVSLMGGYAGPGAPDPDARDVALYTTTLTGDLLGDDLPGFVNDGENAYNVVTGTATDPTAVIDGFTITGGHANGPEPGDLNWVRGAGMWTFAGSPTVSSCTFVANRAQRHGGGMYNHTGSNPIITDCVFDSNQAVDFAGGGMFNCCGSSPTVTSCTFTGNAATAVGGAMRNLDNASPIVTDCTFTNNLAFNGGAMHDANGSNSQVSGCTFTGNSADLEDGAGGAVRTDGNPTFDNCVFELNHAWIGGAVSVTNGTGSFTACTFDQNNALAGGAMYVFTSSPMVIDCDFTSNSSNGNGVGGAVVNTVESHPTYTNCTFIGNAGGGSGGAMGNFLGSNPTITGCTFTNNSTNIGGGGMINQDNCNPIVSNCSFTGNAAGANGTGGGMRNAVNSNPTVTDCTFTSNTSINNGGGMYNFQSSPRVTDCEFTDNSGASGGGMRNFDNSSPTITACLFNDNHATVGAGGAIANDAGSPAITNCTFIDNDAVGSAGALFNYGNCDTMVMNCSFSGNVAGNRGGAMRDGYSCSSRVVNCTFTGNSAVNAGGAISLGSDMPGSTGHTVIENCILWSNTAPATFGAEIALIGNFPNEMTVSYSDVQGGAPAVFVQFGATLNWGSGNIDADPMFTFGHHMAGGSPCIDAGHNWAVLPDAADLDGDGNASELTPLDLDGNPRFADDALAADTGCGEPVVVDMGPFEYQGSPFAVVLADLSGDGAVDTIDFLDLLAAWGPCMDVCCLADLDRDGVVDTVDFLLLLSRWTI